MQPTTHFVDLGGRTRIARYGGAGPPVVLVHGLGGSHQNWNALAPMLTDLGEVVALDLAGFGESPPEGRKTTVQGNAELVMRLMRTLGPSDEVTLIGNSMGGLISMLVAAQQPLRRLILIDPAVPVDIRRYEAAVATQLVAPTLPVVGPMYLARLWASTPPSELVRHGQGLVYADPSRADVTRTEEAIAAAAARKAQPWAPAAFVEAARSIGRTNVSKRRFRRWTTEISAPTLVIHGTADRLVPVDSARWLKTVRPEWRLVELAGVGHVPMLEQPKETFDAIVDFWVEQ